MALGLPKRRLSGAGTAGSRRIGLALGGATLLAAAVGGVVWYAATHGPDTEASSAGRLPATNDLPAGEQNTAYLEELRRQRAKEEADAAQRSGSSYTSQMTGTGAFDPGVGTATETITFPQAPPAAPRPEEEKPKRSPVNPDLTNAYATALSAFVADMAGKSPSVNLYAEAERGRGPARGGAPDGRPGQATGVPTTEAAASPAAPARRKQTLLGGGRGVFGQILLGGNTDQGNPPIVAEVLSGPFVGARAIGSLSSGGQQNGGTPATTVRITTLNLSDGRTASVNGILVAADEVGRMESAIASRVDPHTMERIVLPAAARFVAGLGQAIALSGSFASYGPFGGSSAYRTFNPQQLAGIAAGAAGQEAAGILREQAPRSRTVYVDGKSEVGILFLSPVEVED